MRLTRNTRPFLLDRSSAALAWLALGLTWAANLCAQPTGGQVLAGEASIAAAGASTMVTAGNNAVLRWNSFDIPAQSRVEFVQPGQDARVLNWIGAAAPSQIDGRLQANGQVYLMNSAGIYFGHTAVVDVGGLYAVGGSLSKEDFLAGVNRFTDLTGDVRNAGTLQGASIALIGRSIVNTGSIVAPDGFVGLAAGEQVFLRREGSRILVDAGRPGAAPSPAPTAETGVANHGSIAVGGGTAVLAAGDIYAVAITHDGRLAGREVRIEGQGAGDVLVRGTIDATSTAPGVTGGAVTISGERVGLLGSTKIDASGDGGGGSIRVGGDYQGANAAVRNSQTTVVGPDTVLRADATQGGDGGRIIIWADGSTRYAGHLSARGTGPTSLGGFAEVSGKQQLSFMGSADLATDLGTRGTLLLDPTNIRIQANTPNINGDSTTGDDLTLATKDALDEATLDFPGASSVITTGAVLTLLATTDLTLAATNTITVADTLTWDSVQHLTLTAGNTIAINAPVINAGAGDITLNAGAGGIAIGADVSTAGVLTLNHAGALTQTVGRVSTATLILKGAGVFGTSVARIVTGAETLQLEKAGGNVFLQNFSAAGTTVHGSIAGGTLDLLSRDPAGAAVDPASISVSGGTLTADAITLDGMSISVASKTTTTVGALVLSADLNVTLNAELDAKTSATVRFGGRTVGALTINADVTAPAGFSAVGGRSGDTIHVNLAALTAVTTIDGGAGADTVNLPAGNQAITVSADNAFTVSGVAFSSIETVSGGAGTDSVTLTGATADTITVNAIGGATVRRIDFTGIESIDAGDGTDAVTLTGAADSFQITGAGAGNGLGISFLNIESVAGGAGNDTLSNGTGSAFSAGSTSLGGVTVSSFETINTAALLLGAGADVFTLTGTGTGTSAGVSYTGLSSVNALGGSDTVELTGGADSATVTGAGLVVTGGITFSQVETVDGGDGTDTLVNGAGTVFGAGATSVAGIAFSRFEIISTAQLALSATADAFTVTGNRAGSFGGVDYVDLSTVDALGGIDSVLLTPGADTFSVTNTGIGTVAGITFSNLEQVDARGGSDTLVNAMAGTAFSVGASSLGGIGFVGFEIVDTAQLNLTAGVDVFAVTGAGSGTIGGVRYTGLSAVNALGGLDTVTLTSGDDAVTANSAGAVTVAGIGFSGIEALSGGGGGDAVTLTAGNNPILVTGANAFTATGISFTGITQVNGGGGADAVTLSLGNDAIGVTGHNAFTAFGLNFTAIASVAGNGGVDTVTLTGGDDTVTVTGLNRATARGIDFTQIAKLDGGGGADAVTLTAGNDTFTVTGANAGDSNGFNFLNIESVNGGAGDDSLVNSTTTAVSGAFTALAGITFTSFEGIRTAELQLTAGADSFTQTGNGAGTFNGVNFTGLVTVDGLGGTDAITLTPVANAIVLTGANAASTGGIAYSGIEAMIGNGGADTLTLTAAGETVAVTGGSAFEVSGIAFSGVSSVAGGGGTDMVRLTTGADAVTVNAANAITTSGIAFTAIEAVVGNSGSDTVTFGAANDIITVTGPNAASASGIAFSEIEVVATGAGENSVLLTAGDDTFTITGPATGQGAGLSFTGIKTVNGQGGSDTLVNGLLGTAFTIGDTSISTVNFLGFETINTALLRLTAGADSFTVTGPQAGAQGGIAFTGLTAVDALAGTDTLTLTAGNDALTVTGAKAVTVAGIAFSNLENIAGNGGTDTATLGAGADFVTVTGANAFTTASLAFSAFEAVDTGGGSDSVILTAAADAITLNGPGAATTLGLAFTNVESIDAGLGIDSLTLTAGDDAVTVLGTNRVSTAGITFERIEAIAGHTGTDTITLTAGVDIVTVQGSKAAQTYGISFTEIEAIAMGDGTDAVTLTAGNDSVVVNGLKAVTTHDIAFTGVDVIAGNGGNDAVTLTAGADVVLVTGLNSFTTAGIAFSQFNSVLGGDGVDSVLLTTADDNIVVNGSKAVTVSGIAFSEVEAVDGGAGAGGVGSGLDVVTLTSGDDMVSLAGANAIGTADIAFTGIEIVRGGTGINALTLTTGVDAVVVTAANDFTVGAVRFQEFGAVAGNGGADTVTLSASADTITVNGANAVTAAGIAFTQFTAVDGGGGNDTVGLTAGNDMVQVLAPKTAVTAGITLTNIEAIQGNGGTDAATLTADADAVTVIGPNAFTTANIDFSAFSSVDTGAGTDTVTLTAGADTLALLGSQAVAVNGLSISNLEAINAGAGADTFTLTAANDEVVVTGAGEFTTAGIAATGIEAIVGNGGTNSLILSGADDLVVMDGANAFTTQGVAFSDFQAVTGGLGTDTVQLTAAADNLVLTAPNAITTAGVAFTGIEIVDAAGGVDTLTLSVGNDAVAVSGPNRITTGGITFDQLEAVDGVAGTDTVTLTASADAVSILGLHALTTAGVTFSNFDQVDAAGGNDVVTLTVGDDAITLVGPSQVSTSGLTLTNIEAVAGNGGVNTLLLTGAADVAQITGQKALSVGAIAFSDIASVDAAAGSDTVVLTAGDDAIVVSGLNQFSGYGMAFTNIEVVDGGGGVNSVALTPADDIITIAAQRSVLTAGMTFLQIDRVAAGAGVDTLVLTAANDTLDIVSPGAITAYGIAFSELEVIDGGGGFNTVVLSDGDNAVDVTGSRQIVTSALTVKGVDAVDAKGGTDTVTLTAAPDTVTLTGFKAVTLSDIAFSQIEAVDASGGINTLILTGGNDEILVNGSGSATAAGIAFTALSNVYGSGGSDRATLRAGEDEVELTGDNAFTTANLNFREMEQVDGGGGANRFRGTSAADAWTVSGVNAGTVRGLAFVGFQELRSGGSGVDTFTFTSTSADVTGMLSGEGAALRFENSTSGAVNISASITTPGLRFGSGSGGFILTNSANQIGTLAGTVGGSLLFRNTGAFTVGAVDGVSGLTVGTDLLLDAQAGLLTLQSDVSAGRHASLKGAAITQAGALRAGATAAGGTLDVVATTGSISMASGASAATGGGTLRYGAAQDLELASLEAGTGEVSVVVGGRLNDVNGAATNLVGGAVRIQVGQGTVGSSARGLEIEAGTVAVQSSSSVYLDAKGPIVLGGVETMFVNRLDLLGATAPVTDTALATPRVQGEFMLTATGAVVVSTAHGIEATGGLSLQSTTGEMTVNGPLTSTGGAVSLQAASTVRLNGSVTSAAGRSLLVEAQTGDLIVGPTAKVVAGGSGRLVAGGNVTLGDVQGNTLSVVAGANIRRGTTNTAVTGQGLRLEAGAAIGTAAEPILMAVEKVEAMAASGSLFLQERDGLVVGGVGAVAVDRFGFSGTTVLTDQDLSGVKAAGAIEIVNGATSAGHFAVTESIVAGDALSVRAMNSGVTVEATLSAGRHLSLLAAGPLIQNALIEAGKTDSGATLTVETTAGDLVMTGSAIGRATGGAIRYAATGNIALAALESTGGKVNAEAGASITDANGAAINVKSGAGLFVATTGSVGTAADALETAVDRLDARVRDNIYVNEIDGLTIGGTNVGTPASSEKPAVAAAVSAEEIGGLRSVGTTAGRAIIVTTGSGQITVAPGATVSTSVGAVTPVGTLILGTGTTVRAGATAAGSVDVAASTISGDLRSAGSLTLRGTRVEASAGSRGSVHVGAGTTVLLQGGDVLSFGRDTVVNAPLQKVARIEAAGDVVIGAAVAGVNLTVTADLDQTVAVGDTAAGGVLVSGNGRITNTGTLQITGSALGAGAGAAAGQAVHIAGLGTAATVTSTGDLTMGPRPGAPNGATVGIVGAEGAGGVASTGGHVTLTAAPGGSILLQGSSATAPLVSAAGKIALNSAVLVNGKTRVVSTNGGEINFAGALQSGLGGGGELVVSTAGVTRFAGAVGATNPLASLSTDSIGRTEVNGGLIRTTGAQHYGNEVILGANTTLSAAEATFAQSLRGAADGLQSLTLAVAGATLFKGSLGDAGGRLAQLTTDTAGTTRFDGAQVNTTGAQTYAESVLLGGKTNFIGSALIFQQAVDSAPGTLGDLTATTSGEIIFAAGLGQNSRVGAITTSADSTVRLRHDVTATTLALGGAVILERAGAQSVTTSGNQTYGRAPTLGTDVTLTSTEADLTLEQGVTGAGKNLSVLAPKGVITAGGNLGDVAARLQSVQADGTNVIVSNVFATGDIFLSMGADPGSASAPRNAFLQINGTAIDSEKGSLVLGSGARTPDNPGDDKSVAPLRSSIFKSSSGDLHLMGNTIVIQPFERLAVRDGSLVVFADTSLTISNISASQTIALISPLIQVRSRGPESVVINDVVQQDRGTDLVAARILFFRGGGFDTPTRETFGAQDFVTSQGNILTNLPEVIRVLPSATGSPQSVFVADLSAERDVLRPAVPSVIYLDLRTAAGLHDAPVVPPTSFGAENETPVFSLVAAGQLRASLEQAYVPVLPRQDQSATTSEAPLAPAVREQLQALGIYARALLPSELAARGRRAGLFTVVPAKERPREADYEVVDARVEGASVREVLRLAAVTGLIGDNGKELAAVAEALATVYDAYSAEVSEDDPRQFRDWIERRSDPASQQVVSFIHSLQKMFRQVELLGLTRQELDVTRSQIYGSILMPRLNADPDFLRGVVEARTAATSSAAGAEERASQAAGQ